MAAVSRDNELWIPTNTPPEEESANLYSLQLPSSVIILCSYYGILVYKIYEANFIL